MSYPPGEGSSAQYTPQEGVDYLIDLYQITGVSYEAEPDLIKRALNQRARQYHPDRLEGLAPEFQAKGERMARLLNRARTILLDDEKRTEYDAILRDWDGPISSDGTPVIRAQDLLRAKAAMLSPEKIEAAVQAKTLQAISMVGHDPRQQEFLERMVETAQGDDAEMLRTMYDEALLAEDRVLAIEESTRAELLGLPEKDASTPIALDHAEKTQAAIEAARTHLQEEHRRRALGGVGARLAILAGEQTMAQNKDAAIILPAAEALPSYFEDQARRMAELAEKRQELLDERLEFFRPTYPIAEQQTEARRNVAMGMIAAEGVQPVWVGLQFNKATMAFDGTEIPDDILQQLQEGQFEHVYTSDFNILTFTLKEHIDPQLLLKQACVRYLEKYYSESME